jgi:hypothetical protein
MLGIIIDAMRSISPILVTHKFATRSFFKHKYLTMPTITPADALIRAANDLTDAISGVIPPPPNMTRDAVYQLMLIFKQQAKKAKDNATTQRVLKERTQAERVHNKSTPSPTGSSPPPPFKVDYPNPVISQDEDNNSHSSPASNTCY